MLSDTASIAPGAAAPALEVQRVESVLALEALSGDWARLAAAHGEGLPFRTWEWNAAWWRHFAHARLTVRDRLWIRAFRAPDGELVGVAPLMITQRPGVGGVGPRVLDFFGADPNVTELRGLLCDPAWEEAVHRALLAHVRAARDEWDWMWWRGLRAGSEAERIVLAEPGLEPGLDVSDYLLSLPDSWEAFRSSRSRNIKESLRKCYNSLARDGHAFELRVVTAPEEVPAALERFHLLHGARAQRADTIRHRNVFSSGASRGFLLDAAAGMARRGALRVFELWIGGAAVASRIAFLEGGTLYLYFSGYDAAWSKYSVMTTTVAEALKYAIASGIRTVNLSPGTDVSKTRWDPDLVTYRSALQCAGTPRGRALRSVVRAGRRLARGPLHGALRRTFGRSH